MCRETSVANACSELLWAYSRAKVRSSPVMSLIYGRQGQKPNGFFWGILCGGAWESSEGTLPAPDQKRAGEGEEFETSVQAAKKDLKYQPERSDKQNGPERSGAEAFDFLDEELESGVF